MITFRELKKVLSCNEYTLKISTGCDYEYIKSADLFRDNELYNAYNNYIVSAIDIYDDPENNIIELNAIYFDDKTGDFVDAVTGEILSEHIQKEVKNND